MSVHRSVVSGVLIASLALVGAACKPKPAAFAPPPPPEVEVARPTVQTVPDTMEFTGTTRAKETVEIRARVRGFIETKHVREGQRVKAGELLYTIDPRPFEAVVRQGEAEVAAAEAALQLAETTLERTRETVARNAAAKIELDRAQAERDSADARLKLAKARLDAAKLDLEWTKVKSPIEGRLGISPIEVGQLVGATEPTLLGHVVNDSQVYATYFIGERDVLNLRRANQNRRPGEDGRKLVPVRMALANDTDFSHQGVFAWADNAVNPETGTIKIEAIFDNPDGTILPGLFVRVQAVYDDKQAMTVPDVAVQRDQMGAFLLVVGKDNKVERRNVTPGPTFSRARIIENAPDGSASLSAEDWVIVNGIQRARPGAEVKPMGKDSAAKAPEPVPAAKPADGAK
jgi:RND family efflux transporter MFP subunit